MSSRRLRGPSKSQKKTFCREFENEKMISEDDLKKLIRVAEERNCHILVDETYRELTMGKKLPTAASLSPLAISVESMSKSYGLPGIRTGWRFRQAASRRGRLSSGTPASNCSRSTASGSKAAMPVRALARPRCHFCAAIGCCALVASSWR